MKTYRRNQETISGQIDDEIVMVDIEKGSYFSLNPVATRIWELLEQPLTLDGLCDQLLTEYDVSAEECRADVAEHLTQMQTLGLVREVD